MKVKLRKWFTTMLGSIGWEELILLHLKPTVCLTRSVWNNIATPDPPQHCGIGKNIQETATTTTTTRKNTPPNKHSIRQQCLLQGITSFAAISFAQKSQSSQLGAHGMGHRTQASVGDGKVYIDFFTSLYIWMFPKRVVLPNHSNPWFWVLTVKDI